MLQQLPHPLLVTSAVMAGGRASPDRPHSHGDCLLSFFPMTFISAFSHVLAERHGSPTSVSAISAFPHCCAHWDTELNRNSIAALEVMLAPSTCHYWIRPDHIEAHMLSLLLAGSPAFRRDCFVSCVIKHLSKPVGNTNDIVVWGWPCWRLEE